MSTTKILARVVHTLNSLALPIASGLALLSCTTDDGSPPAGDTPAGDTSGATTNASETTAGPSASITTEGSGSTAPADTTDADDTQATQSASGSSSESTGVPLDPGPDFRERGPFAVSTTAGQHTTGGCNQPYDVFTPDGVATPPVVILAHGFQGNRASMVGWADHWASWGLVVVTPDLCHATILDADHAQNGADLVALAEHLGDGPVAFAGYSAGGLAAVLATAARPTTPVLVALDMVDSGGLGAAVAADIVAPALDLTAETAMCNSSSNGVPVFSAMNDHQIVRLVEADHCDFQNPGDSFCGLCAAPNDAVDPETIAATIRGMSAAALLWKLDVDATGAQWWTAGGPYFDALFTDGLVVAL